VLAGVVIDVAHWKRLLADLGYIGLHPDAVVGYKRMRSEKVLPVGKEAANRVPASLRAIGERANALLKCWRVLANDFRGNPRRITTIVKAVQTLQYLSLAKMEFGQAPPTCTPAT